MARRIRPAGVQTKREEEDSPKPGRKLYALHKNMHSFGFMIGTDTVAKQYFEKVSQDLKQRFQSVEPKKRPVSIDPPVQEANYLRRELQRKDAELRQVKKSYQALLRVNHQPDSERLVQRADAEVETEAVPDRQAFPPFKPSSPVLPSASPGYSSAFGMQDLLRHPAFQVVRYTRNRPKQATNNPILGYPAARSFSPQENDPRQHSRDRSFAEYGSMVLR